MIITMRDFRSFTSEVIFMQLQALEADVSSWVDSNLFSLRRAGNSSRTCYNLSHFLCPVPRYQHIAIDLELSGWLPSPFMYVNF
jgi:hypothetical protein